MGKSISLQRCTTRTCRLTIDINKTISLKRCTRIKYNVRTTNLLGNDYISQRSCNYTFKIIIAKRLEFIAFEKKFSTC